MCSLRQCETRGYMNENTSYTKMELPYFYQSRPQTRGYMNENTTLKAGFVTERSELGSLEAT